MRVRIYTHRARPNSRMIYNHRVSRISGAVIITGGGVRLGFKRSGKTDLRPDRGRVMYMVRWCDDGENMCTKKQQGRVYKTLSYLVRYNI